MSWSISFMGKPEKVAEALEQHSAKLDGNSKLEYDSVLPHLVGIVKQNYGDNMPAIRIEANGHGFVANDEQKQSQMQVKLEMLPGLLV